MDPREPYLVLKNSIFMLIKVTVKMINDVELNHEKQKCEWTNKIKKPNETFSSICNEWNDVTNA